jgi:hypothetical protein
MKKLTIFLNDSSFIEVNDDDDEPVKTYAEKISNILQSNNITILYFSSDSIIIRPNKISAIKIHEITTKLISKKKIDKKNDSSILIKKEKNNINKDNISTKNKVNKNNNSISIKKDKEKINNNIDIN